MKTWRERIAEARERGAFTLDDHKAWEMPRTCLVGEVIAGVYGEYRPSEWSSLNTRLDERSGKEYQCEIVHSMGTLFSPERTEQLLEMAEDEMLAMKREAQS